MTYRTSIQDAIKTIGRAKDEVHKNPDLEHVPVRTFIAIDEWKDRYEGCTCTKELDSVIEVLIKAEDMLRLFPVISECLKAGVLVDLSSLEDAGSVPLRELNKIEYIKLVRSITDLDLDGARSLAKRVAESEVK